MIGLSFRIASLHGKFDSIVSAKSNIFVKVLEGLSTSNPNTLGESY